MNVLRLIPRNRPRSGLSQAEVLARVDEDMRQIIGRGRFMGDKVQFGHNPVHAVIGHGPKGLTGKPGTYTDLGWATNLITTAGMDWLHNAMGGKLGLGVIATAATAVSTTAVSTSAGVFTASAHVGQRVIAENGTDAPVWANIGANGTASLTIDSWHYGADTVGATPAAAANIMIMPGMGPARYMALTTDTTAPATSHTALQGTEINASGISRALCVYAHTPGAVTYTQYKIWTSSGTHTDIHTAGLFTCETLAAAGTMAAETFLNAHATLADTDTLAVTWTWTLPAAA
jgi:hypothetical protein